ncbi:MAG: exo-alpha-sialidase [Actinomycetota bacterium]|nr:exo-alpha-sialidase [Actinomycetota bacterium]
MRRPVATALVLLLAAASAAGVKLLGDTATRAPLSNAGGSAAVFSGPVVYGIGPREESVARERKAQATTAPPVTALSGTSIERRRALPCGRGRDIVNADHRDRIGAACEVVSVRVSRDNLSDPEAQHETQVEPDSFAYGATIVTAFQIGRFMGGGALATGFATSRDAGRTWRSGVLPRLSLHSRPPGPFDLVSDPSVAYDAVHGDWLIASLVAPDRGTALAISRSRDGVTWNAPVLAAPPGVGDYDKEWISCDNWPRSPYRGRCYLSYVNFGSGALETRRSNDGGKTWSAPALSLSGLPGGSNLNGAFPISRPDGTLLVFYTVFNGFLVGMNEIAVASSDNGGLTFQNSRVSNLMSLDLDGVRAPPFVSAAQDARGVVYAAWSDCRFQEDCTTNGIVYSRSRDGVAWSTPARVATGDGRGGVDHFLPGLDVLGSGPKARVAITYYSRPQPIGCGYTCSANVDVWLSESATAGRTWLKPQRLNKERMKGSWIADSNLGKFLGDYLSTSYVRGRPMAVFALAQRPAGGRLRQATYVTTRITR